MEKCPCSNVPNEGPRDRVYIIRVWEPELQVHLNQSEVAHSILNLFRFVGPRFVSTCVPYGRSPECLLKKAWDCLIQA